MVLTMISMIPSEGGWVCVSRSSLLMKWAVHSQRSKRKDEWLTDGVEN